MSVKRGDGVGAGAGAGAGVGVYLFLKECCFKVRIRNRVDTYRSSKILFFFSRRFAVTIRVVRE